MLPSLVATEVASALAEFVRTRFLPSNPRMTRVIEDFLRTPENLLKGPYLSLALPFQTAPEGGEAFPEVPLGFVPWRHQRSAFDRLRRRQSTIVATGTGSGKTECFLLPILDDCRIHSGEPGIKAILIYPMNALANDQAGRIAKLIHNTTSLRGRVTAGIYVGQDRPSDEGTMTAGNILSDRTVMVERPPDILLTNYKMLDYLLSRPRDQRLWRHNGPDTLRWLVVDELHTFDGAQGTDLACLIRRLKARVGKVGTGLTCVGTSATLGDSGKDALVDYVTNIFGEPFDGDSIIGESRQPVSDFLRESPIRDHLPPGLDLSRSVDPSRFESTEAYLRHQCELFFGSTDGDDVTRPGWRSTLGERLRRHATFHRLLGILEGGPRPMEEIADSLHASLPGRGRAQAIALVNGLFALISYARSEDGSRAFLDVSAQLWVREMGRMVCSISEDVPGDGRSHGSHEEGDGDDGSESAADGERPHSDRSLRLEYRKLRHSDDLDDPGQGPVHLPLIQCHSCRATGWGAVLGPGGSHVNRDLRHFYNQFFDHDVDVRFLFPIRPPKGARSTEMAICGSCGYLGPESAVCNGCGPVHMVGVFVPVQIVQVRRRGGESPRLSLDCPFCTARDALAILGARSSVLVSAALAQVYASHYNDDLKVIAFSDNVQDAAHRAAFVAHRTWRTSKRSVIAQAVPEQATLPLSQFPSAVVARAKDFAGSGGPHASGDFVGRFTAPDRTWLREFKSFQRQGRLQEPSTLPELIRRRLEWEALSEAGFGAKFSHSLQRARVAAVGPNLDGLHAASEAAVRTLRQEIGGLEDVSVKQVRWIALGILRRMLRRGAILSDGVEAVRKFINAGCTSWNLNWNLALPEYGSYSPMVFPGDLGVPSNANGMEPLVRLQPKSWYQRWVDKVLLQKYGLLGQDYQAQVLQTVLERLRAQEIVSLRPSRKAQLWGLNPDQFRIGRDARVLHCMSPTRELIVPRDEAALWIGAPCMDLAVQDSYHSHAAEPPTWAGRMYRTAAIRRVWAAEHTALLSRRKRDRIQERFAAQERRPLDPNLLSATPTLEMGIDIGDLSTVVLCSVPPTQANYLQRVGRAGRRDGNSLALTVAAARVHDLSFYAHPDEMLHGSVSTPGVFLNASAVLERQLTSFCLDDWAASCGDPDAVPTTIGQVLEAVRNRTETAFPYTFFSHIGRYRDAIFRRFADAFGESLNDDTMEYLRMFLWGEPGRAPELELKILNRLQHALKEQDAVRRDARSLGRRLSRLNRAPDDEAVLEDRQEVTLARKGLGKLSRSLRNRDTFGFLADEGLIPNYAFPEEGVVLRSVIVRNKPRGGQQAEQAGPSERRPDSEAYQYMRPASAALSELAPDNRFFAEGHRVTIDRINLAVSAFERWRLCPNCTHLERIDSGDEFTACPRCGDPMWSDGGQVRTMLPLRLVHATTGIRRAQIRDNIETRDPLFFTRHLVAEADPQASRKAYGAPPAPGRPAFGFEYVSATTFREMNFGPVSEKGRLTQFDGKRMPRVGFRICKRCGSVQSRRPGDEPRHDLTCTRGDHRIFAALPDTSGFDDGAGPASNDPDIIDCLYLYREFVSESLSVLMPGVDEDDASPQVQSFIAAVELGLKRKFRGKVDHIRAMVQRKLVPEQSARRNVLILYDSVPGGTGYLKELANTSEGLMEVFCTALDRMVRCNCDDGCHRCLRAYRRGSELPNPSKKSATRALRRILAFADSLERVESVDNVASGGSVESELEARFLSALRTRAGKTSGIAFRNAIVRGRSGWALTVNQRTWTVEPQVNLGVEHNVVQPSKPDFVMYPPAGTRGALPVAVFLDGFDYHRDATGDDSVKRMALIRAGFLQWSLTWHDLDSAFGHPQATLDLLRASVRATGSENPMTQVQHALDGRWGTGPLRGRLHTLQSSFDLLLRYLEEPDGEKWRRAVFTDALCLFDRSRMVSPAFRERFEAVARDLLPEGARNSLAGPGSQLFYAGGGPEFGSDFENATLLATMPPSAIQAFKPEDLSLVLHLDDLQPTSDGYRELWNGVLRTFNLIQFLSESWWTTATAASGAGYPDFNLGQTDESSLDGDWAETAMEADESVTDLLREVALLGVSPPDIVGYELANAAGIVVAEAELAWTERRVALLREDQHAERRAFEDAGWSVLDHRSPAHAVQAAVNAHIR